jgi:hypothetical protein
LGRKSKGDLSIGGIDVVPQKSAKGNEPSTPNKKLQKHHYAELYPRFDAHFLDFYLL